MAAVVPARKVSRVVMRGRPAVAARTTAPVAIAAAGAVAPMGRKWSGTCMGETPFEDGRVNVCGAPGAPGRLERRGVGVGAEEPQQAAGSFELDDTVALGASSVGCDDVVHPRGTEDPGFGE